MKDNVSYEAWKAQELAESNPSDETKQNIFGALEMADYIIKNNTDKKDLAREVEKCVQSLSEKQH